jgi:hypothetical protein
MLDGSMIHGSLDGDELDVEGPRNRLLCRILDGDLKIAEVRAPIRPTLKLRVQQELDRVNELERDGATIRKGNHVQVGGAAFGEIARELVENGILAVENVIKERITDDHVFLQWWNHCSTGLQSKLRSEHNIIVSQT